MGRPRKNPYLIECAFCKTFFSTKSNRRSHCSPTCASKSYAQTHVRTKDKNSNWKGGKSSHELYYIYHDMISRCHRPTHVRYKDYGGRGITVCSRWREDFWSFITDVGKRPKGYTLDRIDNDKGYEPSNVRWATLSEQARNKRGYGPQRQRNNKGRFK